MMPVTTEMMTKILPPVPQEPGWMIERPERTTVPQEPGWITVPKEPEGTARAITIIGVIPVGWPSIPIASQAAIEMMVPAIAIPGVDVPSKGVVRISIPAPVAGVMRKDWGSGDKERSKAHSQCAC